MLRSTWVLARRHRLELLIAVCAVAALLAVAQSTRATARTFERSESWRHATGALSAAIAVSHLWLEEATSGDGGVDTRRQVLAPLAQASALCAGLREGGSTPVGRLQPVDAASRERVAHLCRDLAVMGDLSRERIGRPRSGAGTAIDARYDALFRHTSAQADLLGDELAAAVAGERGRAALHEVGLLALLVGLFVTMGLGGRRYVRERLTRQRLEALALRDPLTGLANHRHFHERLHAELQRARRDGSPATLVVLDLDHFKALNESRSHRVGDRVLADVAGCLRAAVRETDVVGRVGGEQFAVLLPGARAKHAQATADALRGRIARLLPDGAAITASAGLAGYPVDAADAAALFEAAAGAVAWAKRDGRDRTRRYDPAHVDTLSIQQQREEIHRVLATPGAMRPAFQPIVALDTGEVVGFEALTRFAGTAGGPERWFAQARRCGMGGVLEARAMAEALASPGRPPSCFLSVNLSPSALLSEEVAEALPADLSDVVIELTEHEAADAPELAGRLDALRARGARIAVDDAGAGHAGLQQVMRVRPDIIKLDRGLVHGVAGDPARAALIECFVAFARRVGAAVCAEGIESVDDLRAVAALDVHLAQGFGLARPAPPWPAAAPEALHGRGAGRPVGLAQPRDDA